MYIRVCHSSSPEENPVSPADRVTEGCELLDKGVRFPARGQSPVNHYPSLQPQIFLFMYIISSSHSCRRWISVWF